MDELTVRAAGGVVCRRGVGTTAQILLVHRPRLDDWSLPKGKLRRGEHPLVGATREVLEETAVRASARARLPTVSYRVPAGPNMINKVVDYWSMSVVTDHGFVPALVPGLEVDRIEWVPLARAASRLSYQRDITVVTALAALEPLPAPVVVVGAAAASATRARQLTRVLGCFAPGRIVSAAPCVPTLAPLARLCDLSIDTEKSFDATAGPDAAASRIRELAAGQARDEHRRAGPAASGGADHAASGGAIVVCAHDDLIPVVLALLTGRDAGFFRPSPGGGWVLSLRAETVVAVDALP